MKASLLATLEEAIDSWMEEQSSENHWPPVYVGPQTHALMARAAAAVLDACEESQVAEKAGN